MYEVVWLRLAMARFGVTTPTVSIVLSVFMAGLALGSWTAGLVTRRLAGSRRATLIRLYGATELLIASSGVTVPAALAYGRTLLAGGGAGGAWGSSAYYVASGALDLRGAAAVLLRDGGNVSARDRGHSPPRPCQVEADHAFGYLYLANVSGATLGTLASAFVLIELLGFRGTLASFRRG